MTQEIRTLKQQLQQLRELNQGGALSQAQYDESRAALERRLVELVLSEPTRPRPSRRLVASLAGAILVVAAAGYWWTGSPALLLASSGSATAANPSAGADGAAPHPTDAQQMTAMVDGLAARLKDKPDDAEGWAMLARSYTVLGRQEQALEAYVKAIALRKDDGELLADYADALAVKNGRSLAGEPMKWVARALKADPHNVKALALAGTEAFDRKDYAAAVKHWQQAVDFGKPDNPMVQQVSDSLSQARELAGLPAAEKAKPASAAADGVSGTVSLAPALRGQAGPDDTVFVFARDAKGSRMPLAILRKQVRDLPLSFTLDDSLAMSPAGRISNAKQLIIGARISKSGDAMPQPGDLTGELGPVALGAKDLKLEIRELRKP